jgi:pimeloyl-ACP methyl ester carboxylesterase
MDIQHRFVDANGIRIHVAEQGAGPAVVLCHGFPETWYSWRHQLRDLAQAGFRAIAPDMRGYGQTDRPAGVAHYSLFHLVGDMVGLLDALGERTAVIAGHDWGAPVAWHAALMRPDRFRAVIGLSVPFLRRGRARPTTVMPRTGEARFYQLYFQEAGVAEAELEADVRRTLVRMLIGASGDAPIGGAAAPMVRHGEGFLSSLPEPGALPSWLTEADLDVCAGEFERTGFTGGLNWYRNLDRNWELLAPYAGARIEQPALYVAGDRDLVIASAGIERAIATLGQAVPMLRRTLILAGCGHWTQQERPRPVSDAMIEFLRDL